VAFVVVSISALVVSALTLFSGFGLGTLLMPVFAIFFPLEVAVAATAVVHGANNVVKVAAFGRRADWRVVTRFALPAIVCAFLGAATLGLLSSVAPLVRYVLVGHEAVVTPLKLLMAGLMAGFALFELLPGLRGLKFDRRWLPIGGVLSGFFGGLSGHQGALRSAFLAKVGLTTEAFVGTNAVTGFLVDAARLLVYGALFTTSHAVVVWTQGGWELVAAPTAAAFAGVLVGSRLVKKVTMRTVQAITGVMLVLIAGAMGAGLI